MMARCPTCNEIIPAGTNCTVDDTDCFEWTLGTEGSVDDPHTLEIVLSADENQLLECDPYLGEGLGAFMPEELENPPAVQAYRASDQSIPSGALTTVTLNIELYDTDTMHSLVSDTSRLTFNTPGTYVVTFNCAWNKNITGDRLAQILKNGADILAVESKDRAAADSSCSPRNTRPS
jgi:hypothetical protein